MRLAHAVQDAHEPPLEVREGAVDSFQNHASRHVSDRLAEVLMVVQCLVSWQPGRDFQSGEFPIRSDQPSRKLAAFDP